MVKRIHQLATELGVKGTAIVAKCQAEGLDIKNHMSTVSVGLEATIKEWFSEGEHSSTVETTAPVDLQKVKVKTPRTRKKKIQAAEEVTAGAAVEVIPAEEIPAEKSGKPTEAPVVPAETAETAEVKKEPTRVRRPKRKSPQEIAADLTPSVTATLEPQIIPVPVESKTPELIPPAASGEISAQEPVPPVVELAQPPPAPPEFKPPPPTPYTPAPAVLQGPKVIRVERPDTISRPMSRKASSESAAEGARAGKVGLGENNVTDGETSERSSTAGRRGRKRSVKYEDVDEEVESKRVRLRSQKKRSRKGFETEAEPAASPQLWRDRDLQERQQRLAQASGTQLHRRERRLQHEDKPQAGAASVVKPHRIEKIVIKEPITVKELSATIGIRANEIIAKLMETGVMAGINQTIAADAAVMVGMEFGVELVVEGETSLLEELQQQFDREEPPEKLSPRPPVVTFLGHVDHGKTSLLDRIRKSAVVDSEAGGITQHIGSYLYDDGKRRVTFLDTPGHKAFTEMRARGANMTDIAVLVVAVDDGVMPQTEEAINHARAAGVPIVVAVNKIDLPSADLHRVLGQLADKGLLPAEWGGDTEVVKTSAVTGEGIESLVEHLDYIAELRQLKAPYDGPGTGWIIESEMTARQGVVARLLTKSGTLNPGDIVVSGSSYGRIRTMVDASGQTLKVATPAMPIEVTGLNEVPTAGQRFYVVDSITEAAEIAVEQKTRERDKALASRRQITLENLFSEIAAGDLKELNVIVRADVQGSVDVLKKTIMEMNTNEVAVRILHAAVGGISESDVVLAHASSAIIIGFHVVADEHARILAEREGVEIRLYRVIYQIADDIRKALEGMLAPRIEEKPLGRAEVRQVFRISRSGTVAGCYVSGGVINRSARVRLIRDNIVIRDDNAIESLRRVKDDASEVRSGLECGIKLANYDDIKVGDVIEAYELVEISRTLESVT